MDQSRKEVENGNQLFVKVVKVENQSLEFVVVVVESLLNADLATSRRRSLGHHNRENTILQASFDTILVNAAGEVE